MSISTVRVVDTDRYRILEPGTGEWNSLISHTRRVLDEHGCCVLRDFVRPALRAELRRECASIAPLAYYEVETVNAYNIAIDAALPDDHPGRIALRRGNAFVARDQIPGDFIIHRLYSSEPFAQFVAACFGLDRVYELADPLAGLCLNVVNPGMQHPWHFDTNEFTVSMLTQEARGGVFDYCPNIRSPRAENLDEVRAVLTGGGDHLIRRLPLRPGDLQLFKGRYSLHRVSPVEGDTARHSAIFAYSERPGVVGNEERTRQLFGRVPARNRATTDGTARVDRLLD